jgi:hypothetical protein
MRRLAVLTALVIAASSTASADRDRYGDRYDTRYDRDRDRYDRYDGSRWSREYRGRWVPLASRYSAEAQRQFISMRGKGGRFTLLRIEADRGAPVINQVGIEYTNGSTQKVQLDARLRRGSGEVIRLNGRQRINRIVVYTEPGYGGSYSVYGA